MAAPTLPFRTILAPTDFSRCARRAVDYAADLAVASGATLVIQHATELPAGVRAAERIAPGGREPVRADDYARAIACAHLDEEAARVGAALRVVARGEVGGAVETILAAADELGADLIVMGTHGRTGWRRGLLGSVAERVVRGAHCPVLTIRQEDERDPRTHEEHLLDAEVDG